MSPRPTAQHALDRIEGHEEVCAERYRRIDEKLDALATGQSSIAKVGIGLLISVAGWLAVQVFDGLKDRPPSLTATAQAATVTAGK